MFIGGWMIVQRSIGAICIAQNAKVTILKKLQSVMVVVKSSDHRIWLTGSARNAERRSGVMTVKEAEELVKKLTDEAYQVIELLENPNDLTISIFVSAGYKNYKMYDKVNNEFIDVFGRSYIDKEKIRV
jgi:hypothetical protein